MKPLHLWLMETHPSQRFPKMVYDFAYSPNPQNGSSGSDKNNSELEKKPKSVILARRETPTKPTQLSAPHVPQSVQTKRTTEGKSTKGK